MKSKAQISQKNVRLERKSKVKCILEKSKRILGLENLENFMTVKIFTTSDKKPKIFNFKKKVSTITRIEHSVLSIKVQHTEYVRLPV